MDELYQHLLEIPIQLDNYDKLFESVKDYNMNKLNIEKCKINEICNFYDLFHLILTFAVENSEYQPTNV